MIPYLLKKWNSDKSVKMKWTKIWRSKEKASWLRTNIYPLGNWERSREKEYKEEGIIIIIYWLKQVCTGKTERERKKVRKQRRRRISKIEKSRASGLFSHLPVHCTPCTSPHLCALSSQYILTGIESGNCWSLHFSSEQQQQQCPVIYYDITDHWSDSRRSI